MLHREAPAASCSAWEKEREDVWGTVWERLINLCTLKRAWVCPAFPTQKLGSRKYWIKLASDRFKISNKRRFFPQPSTELQNYLLQEVAEEVLQFLGAPEEAGVVNGWAWECLADIQQDRIPSWPLGYITSDWPPTRLPATDHPPLGLAVWPVFNAPHSLALEKPKPSWSCLKSPMRIPGPVNMRLLLSTEGRHLSQKEKEQKRQRTLQCSSVTLYMSQGKLCNYTLSQLLL